MYQNICFPFNWQGTCTLPYFVSHSIQRKVIYNNMAIFIYSINNNLYTKLKQPTFGHKIMHATVVQLARDYLPLLGRGSLGQCRRYQVLWSPLYGTYLLSATRYYPVSCYRLLATTNLPVISYLLLSYLLQVHHQSRIGRASLSLSDEQAVNGKKQDGDNVVNTKLSVLFLVKRACQVFIHT